MFFHENLLAWRRYRGLTQVELAARTRIPQPNIAGLETAKSEPKLSTLERLAFALQISPGILLDQRPPQPLWTRQRIDALVRKAVGVTPPTDRLAATLRVVASEKLAAAGRKMRSPRSTGERRIKQLRAELGPDVWKLIIRRLDKYI